VEAEGLLTALLAVKSTPRTGWMLRGVPPALAETIASHMAESAIIALVVAARLREKGINTNPYYAASIALVHDLAEGFVGDIVKRATDIIGKDLKEKAELMTAKSEFANTPILYKLIETYIDQNNIEARIAKYSEQFSTLLQGLRYMKNGYNVDEITCNMYKYFAKRDTKDDIDAAIIQAFQDLFANILREVDNLCKKDNKNNEK
jgi:putative hydrolase of HD superfamily